MVTQRDNSYKAWDPRLNTMRRTMNAAAYIVVFFEETRGFPKQVKGKSVSQIASLHMRK